MKKYKLINTKNKEEHLCDKITINGFEYYIVDEQPLNGEPYYVDNSLGKRIETAETKPSGIIKRIICSNNPNIDIPKVIDEDNIINKIINEILGFKVVRIQETEFIRGLKLGYNKSQETRSFSEEDMIEFAEWCQKPCLEDLRQPNVVYISSGNFYWYKHKKYTPKELLQFWKEQQTKIIYYE